MSESRPCPFCAMDVAVDLDRCPNCGGNVSSRHAAGATSNAVRTRRGNLWVVLGALMSLAVLGLALPAIIFVASANAETIDGFVASEVTGGDEPRVLPSPRAVVVNQSYRGELTAEQNSRLFAFTVTVRGEVRLDLRSDFDNYLELYRLGEAVPFEEDDDSGSGRNASLSVVLEPGDYAVLVRPYSDGAMGIFDLSIVAPREPSTGQRTHTAGT